MALFLYWTNSALQQWIIKKTKLHKKSLKKSNTQWFLQFKVISKKVRLKSGLKRFCWLATFYTLMGLGIPQFWGNKGKSTLPICFKMAAELYQ